MTERSSTPSASPVGGGERVQVMDVLRGVALFGVFLMNFTGFAATNIMATGQQLLTLPSAAFDLTLFDLLEWLVADKANTLFAFLFGLGFYLQMQRLEARGADFVRVYRRRLLVLLAIGIVHTFFVWSWDILHLYALAGFVLLAARRLSNRALVIAGLICAAFGRTIVKALSEFATAGPWSEATSLYSDEAVLVRQHLSQSGDYFGLVRNFFDWTVVDYLASGFIVGWLFYALGRFFIGAWVGRHEWIARAPDFLPGWRQLLRRALPLGLIVEGVSVLLRESPALPEWEHREFLGDALHLLAVPVLAAGYLAAVVVAFHGAGRRLLSPFAYLGRMALTNYITQSCVIGFVLFGVGPGLALAGHIGTCAEFAIVLAFYAVQLVFSRWWLGRFAYGPAEWIWRALTYGKFPPLAIRQPG